MKKLSFLAMTAVGLMFAACSDKDEVAQQSINPGDFKDGAFIGISLSMPSASNATRANDDLNNGTADEFEVKNATLYIFEEGLAPGEDYATYVAKYPIGTQYEADKEGAGSGNHEIQEGVNATNITSTSVAEATKISNELAGKIKAGTKKYYAYVIINNNGQLNAAEGATFEEFKQLEFDAIGADIAKEANIWPGGLLMTNAPICNYAGGETAPTKGTEEGAANVAYTTLVELNPECVFGSAEEALEEPAACVYVERAAVKITVAAGTALASSTINELPVTVLGWQVINYEPSYFNTRQINMNTTGAEDWGAYKNEFNEHDETLYRFVSLYPFKPTKPANLKTGYKHTTGYRTYFAYDPQYDTNSPALEKTVASEDEDWIALGKHAYTTENTFDVAHQTWQNTTMVTLKVQVGDGETDYYTVGKQSKTLLSKTAAEAQLHNIILGDPDVAAAAKNLQDKIAENNTNASVTVGLTVTITSDYEAGKTGAEFTTAVAYKVGTNAADYQGTGESSLKDDLDDAIAAFISDNEDAVLTSLYKGGISYYNVRIKHFGDMETPWGLTVNADADPQFIVGGGSGVNEIYFGVANKADGTANTPSDAQIAKGQSRFLGRYGVVRDNWYKLSVDKITHIGDAEPVDPSITTPDTPDDEIENYIAVHVHIVPWVLRQQNVQF